MVCTNLVSIANAGKKERSEQMTNSVKHYAWPIHDKGLNYI